MEIFADDKVLIKSDIVKDAIYGDIIADETHVFLSGKTVTIKRVRDGLYSGEEYVIEDGNIIDFEMIDKKMQ